MNRKVLLIEPNYKNKFPPIGLMKIATYFKKRGDNVVFYKGDLKEFLVSDITNDCVDKLTELDDSINWRLRANHIANYIRNRKKEDFVKIGIEDSDFSILLRPWLLYYKDYFHKKGYVKHPKWDWVGVTTLFTFYWDITIETINFAKTLVKDTKNLMVGGVLATIQADEIKKATGIEPFRGTLHTPYSDIDDDNPYVIDNLPLDYSILDEIDYVYPDSGSFYSYSTRGCIRKCPFCAVPILEPLYDSYLPLYNRINETRRLFGDQQNLLLMDNNVLASKDLPKIIDDIRKCGFFPGAKYVEPNQYNISIRNLRLGINDRAYIRKSWRLLRELNEMKSLTDSTRAYIYKLRDDNSLLHLETCTKEALIRTYKDFAPFFDRKYAQMKGRLRYVDFNQGVDARLFTAKRVSLLKKIPIRPLRIAFDDIKTEKAYSKAVKMSVEYGLKEFSNYLLYNFNDKPIDLYQRLKINVELCEELNVNIYSFPMKFHPLKGEHSHDRDYIGMYWNKKYVRAVQAILNATKGKIGRGVSFFEKAFGKDEKEYMELLIMPETFILFRLFFEHLGYTQKWREEMSALSDSEREELYPLIFQNDFNHIEELTDNLKFQHILSYYKNYRGEIADHKSELFRLKKIFDESQNEKIDAGN